MTGRPPELIVINPDNHHATHVGRTADGRQFFLTTPFDPSPGREGNAFVAVYLFNVAGKLLEARIDDLGLRCAVDSEAWGRLAEQRFAELGWTFPRRIVIAPFEIERFGLRFGLIPIYAEDRWSVELHPGNYMAFHEPWDLGGYDT